MLEQKYRARFMSLIKGDINVSDLSDEEALTFALAISEAASAGQSADFTSSEEARRYIRKQLDDLDDGLEHPSISASEFAVDAFFQNQERAGSIIKRKATTHIPEDWETPNVICSQMMSFHKARMIIHMYHEGAQPEEATARLRTTERGHTYVSPAYKKWLMGVGLLIPKELTTPYVKDGWQSGHGLTLASHVGTAKKVVKVLEAFRINLIAQLQAAGEASETASEWVQENAIGWYRHKNGGSETWFAAPWTILEMEKQGVLKPKSGSPREAPENWQSASMLHLGGYKSGSAAIKKRLERFREEQIAKRSTAGGRQDEVIGWVQENAVGWHRETRAGKETWFASPWAIEEMERRGLLKLKKNAAPEAPEGWQSASKLVQSGEFAGNPGDINRKCQEFRKELIAQLQAAGDASEVASNWVQAHAVGWYREKQKGHETWFASPWAIEEMEKQKLLKPKAEHAPTTQTDVHNEAMHSLCKMRKKAQYRDGPAIE